MEGSRYRFFHKQVCRRHGRRLNREVSAIPDTRFAYRALPAFLSTSSSAMRSVRVDKQECLKVSSSKLVLT